MKSKSILIFFIITLAIILLHTTTVYYDISHILIAQFAQRVEAREEGKEKRTHAL